MGSVVTRDVPPDSVVMGVPATVTGTRAEYDRKREEYVNRSGGSRWTDPGLRKAKHHGSD